MTDADHFHFHGAQVGSNNTGEITVILEAVLHAISENWESITIRSDSQWSIKVIQGIWKVRHHKTLVNYIKRLIRSTSLKVSLSWIKGHAGHEGNERADSLAEEGKHSLGRFGTTALPPELFVSTPPLKQSLDPATAMTEASKQSFKQHGMLPRRPWISQETLDALSRARQAEATRPQRQAA